MPKIITKIIMACAAVVLIGYDIIVAVDHTSGNTISEIMLGWAYRIPLLPYAFGVVLGHLFWPAWQPLVLPRSLDLTLLGVSGFLLAMATQVGLYPKTVTPALPMLAGIIAGHFLWSQKERLPKERGK